MKLAQIEFLKYLKSVLKSKPEIIINLQGDMPNIEFSISNLVSYMKKKNVISEL